MLKRIIPFVMVVILAACASPAPSDTADDTITVVSTIGQVADIVHNIGGERINNRQLLAAGTDPHTYVPVESDLEAIQNADLLLYVGLNLEAQLAPVIERVGEDRDIPVSAVGEQLDPALILDAPDADEPDPHLWGDVSRWAEVAEVIRDELIALDPEGEDTYRANADQYLADMQTLHQWALDSFGSLENPSLVTAHDAFEYTAQAYELAVFAPQGISTESEASVADIQAAVDYVVTNEVPAIFFESTIPRDTVDAIVEGAREQGWDITVGGELYADAMGPAGTPEGTYFGMVRSNVETIVGALGGQVATWPFEGGTGQ